MKQLLLATTILAAFGASAFAADLPSKKSPAPAPAAVAPFSWTGCYVGVHGGGDLGHSSWNDRGAIFGIAGMSTAGFIAGGQLGCNYQINQFVVGAEAELWGSTLNGSTLVGGEGLHTRSNFAGDIALRAGYAIDTTLLYAKAGIAMAHYKYRIDTTFNPTLFARATHTGLLLGLGIEKAIDMHWSVKAEYNYINYGRKTTNFIFGNNFIAFPSSFKNTENVFKVGVNYRF